MSEKTGVLMDIIFRTEYRGCWFLRNVIMHLPNPTYSHLRIL